MPIVRFIIALLLLPAVASALRGVGFIVVNIGNAINDVTVPFWLGLGGYFVFQIIFFRPLKTYVFGHELTHALAGILSGARLKSFSVGKNGGSVVLDKANLVIVLAPYFVPLYTVAVVFLWFAAGLFWQVQPYRPWFLFLTGFTLSFHVALSAYALRQGQSDMDHFGGFFSGVVIMLVNCVVVVLVLKAIFPSQISLKGYGVSAAHGCAVMYRAIYHGISH